MIQFWIVVQGCTFRLFKKPLLETFILFLEVLAPPFAVEKTIYFRLSELNFI